MNQNKKNNNQNSIKTIIIFISVIVIAGILGYLSGSFAKHNSETIQETWNQFSGNHTITYLLLGIYVAINIIMFVVSFAYYFKCKKLANTWNGEDEDVIDEVEYKLNVPLLCSNIATIGNLGFFAVLIQMAEASGMPENISNIIHIVNILTFVAANTCIVVIQALVVKLEKELNPEKKGNVLDSNFARDWFDSCDEAQKQIVYQASYKAFNATSMTCMLLWIICVFAQMNFNTGTFPTICVCIIWMVQNITYSITSIKLECNK